MYEPKGMESCSKPAKAITCLTCRNESGKRPIDCRKYFGSDHLKFKRQKKFRCKSKRIRLLAQPKYLTPKYDERECRKNTNKNIEISREMQLSTRLKMLSMPKVRKLVAAYEDYRTIADGEKLSNINKMIQNSMMTMYSRLANVHVLGAKKRQRKWTRADWQRHCEWLKKRACPKKIPEPKYPPQKVVPLSELQMSIYNLSQPRNPRQKYRPVFGYQSTVDDKSKLYIPTKRIIQLAMPKKAAEREKEEEGETTETFYANPKALTYNASERIKELATPKSVPKQIQSDDKTNFGVLKRALKASLSERTMHLSKPKPKDDDDEERPAVNPKALKAKPTLRILELAKPKAIP